MISSPQHYMVVDDDSTNNLICEFTIRKFNRNAIVSSHLEPEKALLYIEEDYIGLEKPKPTIMFLDVNMPGMSGFEFLDEFIKFDEGIQKQFTIYILSSSIEDFNYQAKKYPFVAGFLTKPLRIPHLEEIWKI